MRRIILLVLGCIFLAGCGEMYGPEVSASYASKIGDRYSVTMKEVVVAVRMDNRSDEYKNLHVGFSAIINTKKGAFANTYAVENIVNRSRDRISSLVVNELTSLDYVSEKGLSVIRQELTRKAQKEFDSIFSQWSQADEFKVDIVIVSLYLTDTSVGTTGTRTFW